MSDDLCWQITELQARFELEPTLNDVFVEGQFDKEVLSRCSSNITTKKVVYEIDCVNVPDSLLSTHKLTLGNKQRVIALARELAKIKEECAYKCLVDKDLDHWFGELESTRCLIWTTHCSLDLYFCEQNLLQDILIATAKARISNWYQYYDSLVNVLRSLYSLRLVDRQLNLNMNWIDYDKCLTKKGDQILFDRDVYVTRLLNTNQKNSKQTKFLCEVNKWELKLNGDARLHIRGHDFVSLLAWTIKKFGGVKEFGNCVSVKRLLFC